MPNKRPHENVDGGTDKKLKPHGNVDGETDTKLKATRKSCRLQERKPEPHTEPKPKKAALKKAADCKAAKPKKGETGKQEDKPEDGPAKNGENKTEEETEAPPAHSRGKGMSGTSH